MIKFFRKIRQNLLNKNKVGKYLLYAFGEIILVIIGILIALNLNQHSEQKKAEAKIDAIFEDILEDLETDIIQENVVLNFFRRKDSLLSVVLNTNLTYEDYADKNSTSIWRVDRTNWPYDITDNAYNLLMVNIDAIPEKYSQSVAFLNQLYGPRRRNLEKYINKLEEHVEASNDMLVEMPWFTETDFKKSKEAIEYHLNDYRYKNRVKKYQMIAIRNLRTNLVRYRTTAIDSYKEIASILNKSIESLDFVISEGVLQSYVGTYISKTNPDIKAELTIDGNGFFIVARDSSFRQERLIYIRSKTNFSSHYPGRGVFTFSRSDSGDSITMTIHEGHIPVTYTKIKL